MAVALALQQTLSNLFSGFYITVSKQIKRGDFINIESGPAGFVDDITWRNTTIKTFQNNLVIIPNEKLSSAIITNYNLPESALNTSVQVGVSYGSDLQKVEEVTKKVAREIMKTVPGGVPDFEPIIRYHTLAESSINFVVIFRIKDLQYEKLIIHEFIKKLCEIYKKEGIEIPFPIRTVFLKQQTPE